jgi:putative N-acetylmannosamine-6-phosphate epimerase
MLRVTRARRRRQRVLRIRAQLVPIQMLAEISIVVPSHAAQQQINFVVCFLSHYTQARPKRERSDLDTLQSKAEQPALKSSSP